MLILSQKVVRAVEAASFVMTELSKTRDEADKQLLHAAASAFVTQIQVCLGALSTLLCHTSTFLFLPNLLPLIGYGWHVHAVATSTTSILLDSCCPFGEHTTACAAQARLAT